VNYRIHSIKERAREEKVICCARANTKRKSEYFKRDTKIEGVRKFNKIKVTKIGSYRKYQKFIENASI